MQTPSLTASLFAVLFSLSLTFAQQFNSSNSTNATSDTDTVANGNLQVVNLATSTKTIDSPTTSSSTMSMSTSANANIFQLKTICTCLMDNLDDSEMITCPSSFKINIVSAVLYDMNNTYCEKSENTVKDGFITSIKDDLSNFCTGTNCSISESYLINSVDITHKRKDVLCLAADIKWFCYQFTTTYSIVSTSSSAYGFTYFFYIITLILSSSCILIGAIFILRRFLMIRRHASHSRSRRAAQRAYSAHMAHMNYFNGMNAGGNPNNIWTCTYAPPAYDHIYESSHPINPPPDYDAATMANNLKFHYLKAEDQVVVIYPTQAGEQIAQALQQQQQPAAPQQQGTRETGEHTAQGEFTLQPLYITSVVNPSPAEINEREHVAVLEQIALEEANGQLNLAFKPENPQPPSDNMPLNEPTGASSANENTHTVKVESTPSVTNTSLLKASYSSVPRQPPAHT